MKESEQPFYFEGSSEARAIPAWIRFMLEFGYRWPSNADRDRRIAMISMPCDSHAFGLVSLGLVIRDLGNESANDLAVHHRRLIHYAKRYLQETRPPLPSQSHKQPSGKQASGILNSIPSHSGERRSKYRIVDVTKDTIPGVTVELMQRGTKRIDSSPAKFTITQATSHRYTIENGPIVQTRSADTAIDPTPYRALLPQVHFVPDCLSRSYSGLAIAGRSEGERPTRDMLEQVSFMFGTGHFTLGSLLRVEGWNTDQVSRARFMNMRGYSAEDDHNPAAEIVVADGISSFQKIYNAQQYQHSDLILVYPRTVEREQLEELSNMLERIDSFYTEREIDLNLAVPQSIRVITFDRD